MLVYRRLSQEEEDVHHPSQCQLVDYGNGEWGILDNTLQTVVAYGTRSECVLYLVDLMRMK